MEEDGSAFDQGTGLTTLFEGEWATVRRLKKGKLVVTNGPDQGRELEITRFELGGLMEAGNQIVAVIQIEASVRATGKRLRDLELHLWSFDAAGRVAKFRHVVDTHQHWLASRA